MAKSLLVVEDEFEICDMYRRKFESDGFTVYTALNGEQGLKVAEAKRPDIILLDIMMPVMDGREMLAELRKTSWGKEIPVYILTNLGDEDTMKELEKLNIEGYMVKADFTPTQVLSVVKDFATSLT